MALFRRQTDSWSFCVRSQNITGHFSSLTRSSPAFVWHWAEHRSIFILRRICPRLERLSVEVCRSERMVEERISCVWFPRTVRFIRQGTLSGNPIATAAGLATLRILEADTDIYMRLQENTAMLADAVRHAAGNRVHVNQIGSLMSIFLHRRRCDRLRFCDNRGYQSICRLFWVYA